MNTKIIKTERQPSSVGAHGILRLRAIQAGVVLVFLLLLGQAWRLQIVQGEHYSAWADRMRFRDVALPAPRGVIYDRAGQIMVRNIPSFSVYIVPGDLPDDADEERVVLQRLVDLLELTDTTWMTMPSLPGQALASNQEHQEAQALAASLRQRDNKRDPVDVILEQVDEFRNLSPYRSILIKRNISREQAFILEEEHIDLSGVRIEVEPLRQYTTGDLTGGLLGYVGPIPAERLPAYLDVGYDRNDRVGLTGLEFSYEDDLRGVKGVKNVEVDVAGREVRVVGEITPPEPGHNLILTLDLELQRVAQQALLRGLELSDTESGVVIAMDPNTGGILAMVTYPGYDNNLFTGGIAWKDYELLSTDPHRPLMNHAIGGQFPPGSTFKVVASAAGLEEKIIDGSSRFTCEGIMYLPNQFFPDDPELAQPFYCWIHKHGYGHGALNVTQALAQSCDIYFYQLAGGFREFSGLGLDRLAAYAHEMGFGSTTGIDLPGETAGWIPSANWKRLAYSESWVTGDTYNMSIGQGFVLATPLQVLNAYAAIANGGTLYRPHLVKEITDADGNTVRSHDGEVLRELPYTDKTLFLIQKGLADVVDHGTARRAALAGITVAGKTSTAEYPGPRNEKGHLPTHASFVGYAPFEKPEIVVMAFVYGGGEGSATAVPIVTEILSAYFGTPALFAPEAATTEVSRDES